MPIEQQSNIPLPGVAEKLTNWKQEPSIETLKGDVELAKPVQRTHLARIQKWMDNLNVTGSARITPRKGRSSVQPKLIRKQAEWRYAPLSEPFLANDNMFNIQPTSWEDVKAAQQNALVLNWQFRTKINKVTLIDQYIRACVDEGVVAVRCGWDRETKMEKVKVPVYGYFLMEQPEQIQALTEASQLELQNPNAFKNLPPAIIESVKYSAEKQQPYLAKQIGEQEVEQEKVIRNQPTVEVVNIRNLVVDATCGADYSKAMFMAYSFEITRGALMRDKRYKNLKAIQWGNGILSEPDHTPTGPAEINFKDNSRQKVVINEYYGLWDVDGSGHLVPILVSWIGNVMVRCEMNPFPDGQPPFVIVPYLPIKESIYGEPDGELLEDNQKILGAVTRGMIDIMARSANGQRGMAKSMLDVTNKRRYENGDDYEFNPNVHPTNGIVEHKFPEIPQSAMAMIQMVNMEAESLTGVKTFADGGLTGAALGPTAAGVKGVTAATSQRETSILRRLAKGMADIGAKIVAMNQAFLSEEEVIRITNEEFVTVRREELAGQFDLQVDISTAEEDNAKAQELSFMLQTMGPNMDFNERKLVMAKIARLRRMPELAHQFEQMQPPPPDPLDQQLKQAELNKLTAQAAFLQAQTQRQGTQSQLDLAKAQELGASTDQKNLDFVEQQGGVKHARRLDELDQQAESNQNLAITNAILDQRPKGAHNPESAVPDAPDPQHIAEAFGFNQLTKTLVQ